MDMTNDKEQRASKLQSLANRVAAKIGNYCMKKTFRRNGNGTVTFFYSVKGDFENVTINQLNIISELLQAAFEDDLVTLFNPSNPEITRVMETKMSLERSVVYLYTDLKFGTEWVPTDEFWEI